VLVSNHEESTQNVNMQMNGSRVHTQQSMNGVHVPEAPQNGLFLHKIRMVILHKQKFANDMDACIYIYIYIHTYIHTHIHTHMHVYRRLHGRC